jgi:Protein of unknown function (DUF3102)
MREVKRPGAVDAAPGPRGMRIDPSIAAPSHSAQESLIEHAEWTSRIAAAWQKGVEAILETGRLLIEAKAALKYGEFKSMVQLKLPFNPGTAQRLMAIARHPVISNAAHAPLLPPSWTTLYELTKLSPEALLPKIEDGSITPKTERRDVIAMRPVPTKKPSTKKAANVEKSIAAASARPVRDVVMPDEELALLREFARFVLFVAKSLTTDPKDHDAWKTLRGRVKAMLGGEL